MHHDTPPPPQAQRLGLPPRSAPQASAFAPRRRGGLLARASLCAALVLAGPGLLHAAPAFGTNLIVNPGAEAGAGGNGFTVVAAPGWTTTGNFTVVSYTAGGTFPNLLTPGPADRGGNFFAGGVGAQSSAQQSIDVSAIASDIDGGDVGFELAGFLGGFSTQNDAASLLVSFLGGGNASLGTASIGPVTASDRGGVTSFLARSTAGFLPAGTRSVSVTLQMTRAAGSSNDGYADNLAFVLTAPPAPPPVGVAEPSGLALAGLALLGVLGTRRRARRLSSN